MSPFQTSSLPKNLIHFYLSVIIFLIHSVCSTFIALSYFDHYAPMVLIYVLDGGYDGEGGRRLVRAKSIFFVHEIYGEDDREFWGSIVP